MTVTKAVSLPVGGYRQIEWAPGDHQRFRQILSRLYAKQRLTAKMNADLDRLRKAYRLDRYYRFETSEGTQTKQIVTQ